LGGGSGAELFGGALFGFELVLLGVEHVFADAVVVEQLNQLLLLGLDLLDCAFMAFSLVLYDAGSLHQLPS
jgi:hypothetical protein